MTLIKQLILILIIPTISCFSQEKERQGKLYFNLGPEYRITPIYKVETSAFTNESLYTNVDLQSSGPGLNVGVDFYLTENLGIGYSNSFRYDLITTGDIPNFPNIGTQQIERGLMLGYHFKLFHHWNIFSKGEFITGIGLSLLNRNSDFTANVPIVVNGEQIGTTSTLVNYNYSANKLFLGYGRGKSKIVIGAYITRNSNYFNKRKTFTIPFINYSYYFGRQKVYD